MVTGFNHNFNYHKLKLHIQTEDCGVKKPRIETHLFRDGIIVATRKTSYDDILKVEDLDRVVEELMKDQHRKMLRQLKSGEYDEILGLDAEKKEDKSDEAREVLPDEQNLEQLSGEALNSEFGQVDSDSMELKTEEEDGGLEALAALETKPAGGSEEGTLPLEELVLRYLLGESGRGLRDQGV